MTVWRSFSIRFPSELEPLYNELQRGLNYLLSDPAAREIIESIDYTQHKGKVWIELRDKLPGFVQNLNVKNKAWYARMVFENVRREVQSKRENITIYNELEKNNNKIDSTLFNTLVTQHKIYATRGRVTNILKSGQKPELPHHAVFQLDYTISEKQNFTMDENNVCRIRTSDGVWIDYHIVLPTTLNGNLTGRVAKPRFMKRASDGQYIGLCSYEYTPESPTGNSILGVDIGRIKFFSAVALHSSGRYSTEYIQSKSVDNLSKKLKALYESRDKLYVKIERCASYDNISEARQMKREIERREICRKITRLKENIARHVAMEIIEVAKKEHCSEIHIENLTWLGSQGGKWNHSMTHSFIQEAAVSAGIKVVKVNSAGTSSVHPITHEKGTKSDRIVKFPDGKKIDRDVLGAINIAVRNKGKKKPNKIVRLKKNHPTPKRVKLKKSKKQEIRDFIKALKGGTQIVVFSPSKLAGNVPDRPWSLAP